MGTEIDKSWGDDFGMKILREHVIIPTDEIKINHEYQRCIEVVRLRKITTSMSKSGYWPAEIIILNERYEAVDGNHRVHAAKKLGIKALPCAIVTFGTKKDEVRFFSHKNNWNTSLKPIDAWHAKHLGGHSVAGLLYTLEADPLSLLHDKIAIKGKETGQSKFVIGDILIIVNVACFGTTDVWNKRIDARMAQSVSNTPYHEMVDKVNAFVGFFYRCFGSDKRGNPLAYRRTSIRAFANFYNKLKNQHLINSKSDIDSAAIKMQTLSLSGAFLKTDLLGQIMFLVAHYNNKKSQSKRCVLGV